MCLIRMHTNNRISVMICTGICTSKLYCAGIWVDCWVAHASMETATVPFFRYVCDQNQGKFSSILAAVPDTHMQLNFLWFVQDLLGIGLPHAGLKCRSSLKFKCKACAAVRYVCDIRESCVLPPHLHIFKILWSVTVSRLLLYTEGRKHIFTYPLSFNSHYLLGVSSGALFCCAAFRYVCDIL